MCLDESRRDTASIYDVKRHCLLLNLVMPFNYTEHVLNNIITAYICSIYMFLYNSNVNVLYLHCITKKTERINCLATYTHMIINSIIWE